MPLVSFGIAVLVLGGMSTTLAGTITLNSSGNVEFGQGIVTTAACDQSIDVIPATTFETTTFKINSVTLKGIGIAALDTTSVSEVRDGCLGKIFTLRAYNSASVAQPFTLDSDNSTSNIISFKLMTDTTTAYSSQPAGPTGGASTPVGATATRSGNWRSLTSTPSSGTNADNPTGVIILAGFTASAEITRFTLETSQ
jgi:hypothetical protein